MRILLSVSLFVAACSSGGTNNNNNNNLGDSAAFELQIALAFCSYNNRCGFVSNAELKNCQDAANKAATTYKPVYSPADAVKANKLAYDATKAKACVDAIGKAGCSNDSYFGLGDVCNPVYTGKVTEGGACVSAFECTPGHWCDQGMNQGVVGCAGTCKANTASGGPAS
jgi:hypothetical protein